MSLGELEAICYVFEITVSTSTWKSRGSGTVVEYFLLFWDLRTQEAMFLQLSCWLRFTFLLLSLDSPASVAFLFLQCLAFVCLFGFWLVWLLWF